MKYFLIFLSLFILASCTMSGNTGIKSVSSESRTIPTPTYGKGNHTIEIFADFQCPACINFSHTVGPILESYASSGKVLLEYRQYPLTTIHKNAYRDALAALCSAEQGKYMEMKKALYAFEEKQAGATTTDDDRIATAVSAGLDGASMKACLESDRYKAQVESDIARGDSLGIEGTPTVFLDGKKLDLGVVFRDFDMGKKWLDSVLAK